MDLYGLSTRMIAELTGVSLKTAQRWKQLGRAPTIASQLLQIRAEADLGHLAEPWSGFRLADNVLWTPENERVSPGDIRAIRYRAQQLEEYEREIKQPRQFTLL